MGNPENDVCHYKRWIDPDKTPTVSAIMFAAGIIGNVAALVILEVRRCRDSRNGGGRRRSLFHILITSLVLTDLAGTCLVSPLVQVSYHQNKTLTEMSDSLVKPSHHQNKTEMSRSKSVCQYFGLSMTFFSLATMSLLFTTALERCLAIGYPYLYNRHVTKKCAYITIPVVFLLCTLFCLLPFAGFGAYVQYCPGTWCFIDMNPKETVHRVYANLYASVMLLLVLAIVSCNGFVVYQLYKMYRRRRRNGGSVISTTRSHTERRSTSMAEEVEHLILLVFMTIIFIICTLPLVFRVYINSLWTNEESHRLDLIALLFISMNSIIDPWVFILLSPSVLHFCWSSVCRAPVGITRGLVFQSSLARANSPANLELACPSLDSNGQFQTAQTLPTAETLLS